MFTGKRSKFLAGAVAALATFGTMFATAISAQAADSSDNFTVTVTGLDSQSTPDNMKIVKLSDVNYLKADGTPADSESANFAQVANLETTPAAGIAAAWDSALKAAGVTDGAAHYPNIVTDQQKLAAVVGKDTVEATKLAIFQQNFADAMAPKAVQTVKNVDSAAAVSNKTLTMHLMKDSLYLLSDPNGQTKLILTGDTTVTKLGSESLSTYVAKPTTVPAPTKEDNLTAVNGVKTVQNGDEVNFTVTGEVTPDATTSSVPYFVTISDTMDGFKLKSGTIAVTTVDSSSKSTTLTLDSATKDTDTTALASLVKTKYAYSESLTGSDVTGFKVTYRVDGLPAGTKLVVKYTAIVTSKASGDHANTATQTNRQTGRPDKSGPKTKKDYYAGRAKFVKQDIVTSAALAGAHFEVKQGSTALKFTKVSDGVYEYAPTTGSTDLQTKSDGTLQVLDIKPGTQYNLVETQVPSGYQSAVKVNLPFTASVTVQTSTKTANYKVTPGVEANKLVNQAKVNQAQDADTAIEVYNAKSIENLPKTGAAGTLMFTVVALVFAAVAAVIVLGAKKVRKNNTIA